jgi:hypothetical protein
VLAYQAMSKTTNIERRSSQKAWADLVFPGLQARKQKSVSDMKFWKEYIRSTNELA